MQMSWEACNKLVLTFGGECRGYNYEGKSITVCLGSLSFMFSNSFSVFVSGEGVNSALTLSSTQGIFKKLFCIIFALHIFNIRSQM